MNQLHINALENPVLEDGKPDAENGFGFDHGVRSVRVTVHVDGVRKNWVVIAKVLLGTRIGLMHMNQMGDGLRRKILNAVGMTLSQVGDGPITQAVQEKSITHYRALSEKERATMGRVARPETVEAVP